MLFWKQYKFIHIIALNTVCLKLCYDFWNAHTNYVVLPNPPFKPRWPQAVVLTIPKHSVQSLMNISNFEYLIRPAPYRQKGPRLILALVFSKPENYVKRNSIRKSWGQNDHYWRTVFLVGQSIDFLSDLSLALENNSYGDILQGNFIESDYNLTYKHVMGLRWASEYLDCLRYVLKVDEDVVVNKVELSFWLSRGLSPWGAQGLIACPEIVNAPAVLTFRNKWSLVPKGLSNKTFSAYCAGWAIIYDGYVARLLEHEAQKLPYFWVDDIFVTGILATRVGVVPAALEPVVAKLFVN